MRNYRQQTGVGPDPTTVAKMRRDDREYLNPKDILKLGLDDWHVVKLTGYNENGKNLRIFFEPANGNWKSAVERDVKDWQLLFSMSGSAEPDDLVGEHLWVKLYEHQSRTDIAELAPCERER